jgi:hypothetical protein
MLEKIVSLHSVFVYLLLFLIAIVGTLLLKSFSKAGHKILKKKTGKKARGGLGLLTVLFLTLFAFSFLFFTAYIRAYQAFDHEELVGYLECQTAPGGTHGFLLTFTPVIGGEKNTAIKYSISGDQWVIGGDIIKWKSFLTFLGLKSMYRLRMLEGQYLRENAQQGRGTSIYYFDDNSNKGFWEKMYQIGNKLFVVSGVYGAKVYNYPGYDSYYEIYVTEDSYIAKKISKDDTSITRQLLEKVFDTTKNEEEQELQR